MTEKAILLSAAVQMYIARKNGRLPDVNRETETADTDIRFAEKEDIILEFEALSKILEDISPHENTQE